MLIPIEETATNANGYIPEQVYRVRCLDVAYTSKNGSGNEMNTLKCEIIEPETVQINGQDVVVAGRNFQMFLVHNYEKQGGFGSQAEVIKFHRKLNLPFDTDPVTSRPGYDTKNAEAHYKGMEWDMVLRAQDNVKRYKEGEKKGQPILDGEGKEIRSEMRIQANLDDVCENAHPKRNQEIAERIL